MLGALAGKSRRFPLLIKFLDVAGMLSVQVHPPDNRTDLIPKGENGKTEAWYVLEADPGSRIYAGLKPATTAKDLRELSQNTVESHLASFAPMREQSVLVEAGTVHAIGDGLLVLEVQENSDVTFRLYDWDHIDPATGRGRPLQVEAALACIDLDQGAVLPTAAPADDRAPGPETVVDCSHFRMSRVQGDKPFAVGAADAPRVLVCVDGAGALSYSTGETHLERGGLLLLPAALGVCQFKPAGAATLLEIAAAEPT
jgi:mannose-6-phosphate isomerase